MSRVKSKQQRPNKRQCRETKTSTQKLLLPLPGQTLRASVFDVVAVDDESEKGVGEEEEEEEKTKEKENSQLVGGSVRQGCRDLLFRKVSRLLLSQRAASLRQKPKRRRGVNVVVSSNSRP